MLNTHGFTNEPCLNMHKKKDFLKKVLFLSFAKKLIVIPPFQAF